jgi:hypothetical protein
LKPLYLGPWERDTVVFVKPQFVEKRGADLLFKTMKITLLLEYHGIKNMAF